MISETVYDPLFIPPYVESAPTPPSYDNIRLLPFEIPLDAERSNSISSEDPLCDICSAVPPLHTHMQYCHKCRFHMCGSCAQMDSIENSHDCYIHPEYIGSNKHSDLRKNEQKSLDTVDTDQCVPENPSHQCKLSRYKSLDYAYDPSFDADTYFKNLWDSCFEGPYLGNISIDVAEFYKERTLFKLKRGPGSDYQLLLVSDKIEVYGVRWTKRLVATLTWLRLMAMSLTMENGFLT